MAVAAFSDAFPRPLMENLLAIAAKEIGGAEPVHVATNDEHSNDLAMVRFDDGRTLMVKRARHEWAGPRFDAAALAAELLHREVGIKVPVPLKFFSTTDHRPVQAYWRIELPTLQELWPEIPEASRPEVLRSWGELVRRVHAIKLPGQGPLPVVRHEEASSLAGFLEQDLAERLLPAVAAIWPQGHGVLEALLGVVGEVGERVEEEGTLIHGDLHAGNVLCETDGERIRCVGLLDLETAFAGPPEADLANAEVLHGPLFAQPLPGPWFEHLREGYGDSLDPLVLAFFRIYHLANMGFYSAFIGDACHAEMVAHGAQLEWEVLQTIRQREAAASVQSSGTALAVERGHGAARSGKERRHPGSQAGALPRHRRYPSELERGSAAGGTRRAGVSALGARKL